MKPARSEVKERIGRFQAACRSKGLPLTPQKKAIFEAVASTASHPAAQQVYASLKRRWPSLSFATVYKNLNQFRDLGLVRELRTGSGTSRFDADTGPHAHVYHLGSGAVSDAPLGGPLPLPPGVDAASVDHVSLIYYVR